MCNVIKCATQRRSVQPQSQWQTYTYAYPAFVLVRLIHSIFLPHGNVEHASYPFRAWVRTRLHVRVHAGLTWNFWTSWWIFLKRGRTLPTGGHLIVVLFNYLTRTSTRERLRWAQHSSRWNMLVDGKDLSKVCRSYWAIPCRMKNSNRSVVLKLLLAFGLMAITNE